MPNIPHVKSRDHAIIKVFTGVYILSNLDMIGFLTYYFLLTYMDVWKYPNEFTAVLHGEDAIEAFAKAGGTFTSRTNQNGQTTAMVAAYGGAYTIEAFVRAGGVFTDQQDNKGRTAAMLAAAHGAKAIRAFCAGGGTFTDQQNEDGWTAEFFASLAGLEAQRAYYEAIERQGGVRVVRSNHAANPPSQNAPSPR